jgi:hypothetical protein
VLAPVGGIRAITAHSEGAGIPAHPMTGEVDSYDNRVVPTDEDRNAGFHNGNLGLLAMRILQSLPKSVRRLGGDFQESASGQQLGPEG